MIALTVAKLVLIFSWFEYKPSVISIENETIISFLLNRASIKQHQKNLQTMTKPALNTTKSPYYVLTLQEFRALYPNFKILDEAIMSDNAKIQLFEGDADFKGDLSLGDNWHEGIEVGDGMRVNIVLVLGNLIVEGAIVNESIDSAVSLIVGGKTTASNLFAGGGFISLKETHISQLTMTTYNHGMLLIDQLSGQIFLDDAEHWTDVKDESAVEFVIKLGYLDDHTQEFGRLFADQPWVSWDEEDQEYDVDTISFFYHYSPTKHFETIKERITENHQLFR